MTQTKQNQEQNKGTERPVSRMEALLRAVDKTLSGEQEKKDNKKK
jgi:hypothetical protein